MVTENAPASSAVDDLVAILDLERLEQNLFRGRGPKAGWQWKRPTAGPPKLSPLRPPWWQLK